MPEGSLFKCPSCGSSLSPQGDLAEIKCPYCGNDVIVPAELRQTQTSSTPAGQPEIIFSSPQVSGQASSTGGFSLITLVPVAIAAVVICAVAVAFSSSLGISPLAKAKPTPIPSTPTLGPGQTFAHTVLTFGGEGTGPGLFQEALRITADNDGNSYISDHTTTRIQRFDAAGKYKSGWTIGAEGGDPKAKYGPDELVADRLGNVYALFEGAILKYDAN